MNNTTQENEQWLAMTGRSLLRIADEIDREHERRMEQQSHDLRKAWLSQQRTQLELEALRVKASNGGAK